MLLIRPRKDDSASNAPNGRPAAARLLRQQWWVGLLCVLGPLGLAGPLAAQTISGKIVDQETGEPVVGAAVFTQDRSATAYTKEQGRFQLAYEGGFPVQVSVMHVQYDSTGTTVQAPTDTLTLAMRPSEYQTEGITVTGQAISEKLQESAQTVERMDLIEIEQTASTTFYGGLGKMKGVDVTSASMAFKVINTRGFNSTSPVRTLQLIDGYDNQAPGLNFSLGNFVGVSPLDVQSVDIIQGAGSATYGPGAFNGVISMQTKSPFVHPGLSVRIKMGERRLFQGAIRYAKVFEDPNGFDRFAIKLNASLMRAQDWEADNLAPTDQSLRGPDNPGGYDAVNIYGDENIQPGQNNFNSPKNMTTFPGLDVIYRSGYREEDLVDYNTRSVKMSGSAYYKLNRDVTAEYTYSMGTGTTVYQGDNRYSLKDLLFYQHRFGLEGPNWSLKAYQTGEDAGKSFDAVFTALQLQRASRGNSEWTQSYLSHWAREAVPAIQRLEGWDQSYISAPANEVTANQKAAYINQFLAGHPDVLNRLHRQARYAADSLNTLGTNVIQEPYLVPGTPEFEEEYNRIISNPSFNEGGARFVDRSKLYHIKGKYEFDFIKPFDLEVGGRYRLYTPRSKGTVFSDTLMYAQVEDSSKAPRREIRVWEMGGYAMIKKQFFDERLKLKAATRFDRSKNFEPLFSPVVSGVYTLNRRHNFRLNFTSALRNPTLADQYLYYNVGQARLIGNLNGVDSVVGLNTYYDLINNALTGIQDTLQQLAYNIDPIRPEQVRTIELGYKGNPVRPLFIDATYYFSWYDHFIGYNLVTPVPEDNSTAIEPLRVAANADTRVTTQGFTIGANFFFAEFYSLSGNYTWTVLNEQDADSPIIPAYNTPEHKFNVSLSGRKLSYDLGLLPLRNVGFNFNLKWVEGFLFEGSPQFTGRIDTYWTLDGQVNYTYEPWNTTLKVGASNMLDRHYIQAYGGPTIGRMAYFSVTVNVD